MNTHELYVQANSFLIHLLYDSTLFWRGAIRELYSDNIVSANKSICNVIFYANKHRCVQIDCGIRFIPGSINVLSDKYLPNLLPSEVSKVVSILKEKNRILQLGSGKGKGFIIFSSEYLEEEMNTPQINLIDPSDAGALVKALKENVNDKNEDLKALRTTVTEQQKVIQDQEQAIGQLQNQVANSYQRSWS